MTNEQFLEKVKNRANERVQQKIEAFRDSLYSALQALTGECYLLSKGNYAKEGYKDSYKVRAINFEIFNAIAEQGTINFKGWPKYLWETEEAKVQEEIFNQMDRMQQALLSQPPKDTDVKPAE
jgi:hypothetical protein